MKNLRTYDLISCPVRYRIITPEPADLKRKKSPMNLRLIKDTAAVLDRPMTVESEVSANISPKKSMDSNLCCYPFYSHWDWGMIIAQYIHTSEDQEGLNNQ